MIQYFHRLALIALVVLSSFEAGAADRITVTIKNKVISAYRTADLESAKKEAKAAHKPIAWIASAPELLDGRGVITSSNGRGATLHALFALSGRTILIFEDAFKENHQVLPLVDSALHTPNPHYTPPSVVFLDPDAKQVLALVTYEPNYDQRAKNLWNALEQTKGKF